MVKIFRSNFRATWLVVMFFMASTQAKATRANDSLELVALYNATNGANWTNKTNWLSSNPMDTWYGITLTNGRVSSIQLWSNALNGNIPNLNIPNLETLHLNNNQLSGSIPNFTLSNLKNLYLHNNLLSSNIPNFSLGNLEGLYLNNNQLTGSIPNFNLPNLKNLWLYSNQLSGNIPNFNLPNLEELDLKFNQLSGSIPNFNLPKLEHLYLLKNQLSGNIPNFNLPNLLELVLVENQLSGSIPNFNLPILQTLWLTDNQLTGGIPNFNLPKLRTLSLRGNQLTGSIPNLNLPDLQNLWLHFNQLSGNIPNFSLPNLQNWEFHANKFVFGDIEGKPWLSVAGLVYNGQAKIPLTLTGSLLTVNTGSANSVQQFEWYKNGTLITSNQSNTFSPTGAGTYYCRIAHNTLTVPTNGSKNLVLQSEDYIVNAVLPIELLNFQATPHSKNVQLTWQTATERNSNRFDIERSQNGKSFEKIGQIKTYGNSSDLKTYAFTDEQPFNAVNYYRLKHIDFDGTVTLSNVVSVTLDSQQQLQVFPNPAKDKLTIKSGTATAYIIVDMLNREISKGQITDNQIDVDISKIPTGQYFIKTDREVVKFFKGLW